MALIRSLLSGPVHVGHQLFRRSALVHATTGRQHLHCLCRDDRAVVRVRGDEASQFLQGLITNDMQHLQDGASSMYSMVLNSQGRMLQDIIIYNNKYDDKSKTGNFLIEVEATLAENFTRHLKMYRLRKKIDIDICPELKCWVFFEPEIDFDSISKVDIECLYVNPKVDLKDELKFTCNVDGMIISRDPRMQYLGYKLIIPSNCNAQDLVSNLTEAGVASYTQLRYRLGVAEGSIELPSGKVLPLEANVDFLHGVSFHKGCYIGQELTARVFHTGIVRKRYMPVLFKGSSSIDLSSTCIPTDTSVLNSGGKSVGKLRAHADQYGIALLRVSDCLSHPDQLSVAGQPLTTFRPAWWPLEAPKQKPVS